MISEISNTISIVISETVDFALSNHILSPQQNTGGNTDTLVTAVICLSAIVVVTFLLQFGKTNSWNKGIFPKKLKYNQKNLFEAYISIGLQLFKRDPENLQESAKYMASYLKYRFKEVSDENYYKHIIEMIRFDVSEESVCLWLQEKMPQQERIQLIDFLVDLAFYNELLTRNELIMIYRVADRLGINKSEVDAIVGIRHNKAEEARKPKQHKNISLKNHNLDILGLAPETSFDEVKVRYRELTKRFHPDLFATMGENEIEMAHDRFVAINTAYQYLEQFFAKK